MLVPPGMFKDVKMQTAAAATGNGTTADCCGVDGSYTTLCMQISGTFSATVTFEATVDGTNWIAVQVTNLNDATTPTEATAAGIFRLTTLGLLSVRARVSTYGSGSVTVRGLLVA